MLGSFGDNELSPECLDGAQRFLKQDGISIPSSYVTLFYLFIFWKDKCNSVFLYFSLKKFVLMSTDTTSVWSDDGFMHIVQGLNAHLFMNGAFGIYLTIVYVVRPRRVVH